MKKIILLLSLVVITQAGMAQKTKVNSAWNYLKYGEYDKAKAAIDEAAINEDSKNLWKTWYYKGVIYQAIHEKKLAQELNAGDALLASFEAYKKSLEIDPKHDYANEAVNNIDKVRIEFSNLAFDAYNAKDFSKAYEAFKMRISIYDLLKTYSPTLPTDTGTIYNIALIADKIQKHEDAVAYYKQLIGMKYKEAYALLATDYCKLKDTANALQTLEAGALIYPTDANIIYGFVNIYASTHQFEKAITKINDAIKLTPNNEMLYVILGNAYEHIENDKEAEIAYNKALEKNPTNYDAIKSIGINIYNQAAKLNKEMNELPTTAPQSKYDEIAKQRNEVLLKALPYLEKAIAEHADDEEVSRPLSKAKSLLGK